MPKLPFHRRFNININIEEAQRRFVNRATNQIFGGLFEHDIDDEIVRSLVLWQIANDFGEEYSWDNWFDSYVEDDFEKCLHALESSYSALELTKHRSKLESLISSR